LLAVLAENIFVMFAVTIVFKTMRYVYPFHCHFCTFILSFEVKCLICSDFWKKTINSDVMLVIGVHILLFAINFDAYLQT